MHNEKSDEMQHIKPITDLAQAHYPAASHQRVAAVQARVQNRARRPSETIRRPSTMRILDRPRLIDKPRRGGDPPGQSRGQQQETHASVSRGRRSANSASRMPSASESQREVLP